MAQRNSKKNQINLKPKKKQSYSTYDEFMRYHLLKEIDERKTLELIKKEQISDKNLHTSNELNIIKLDDSIKNSNPIGHGDVIDVHIESVIDNNISKSEIFTCNKNVTRNRKNFNSKDISKAVQKLIVAINSERIPQKCKTIILEKETQTTDYKLMDLKNPRRLLNWFMYLDIIISICGSNIFSILMMLDYDANIFLYNSRRLENFYFSIKNNYTQENELKFLNSQNKNIELKDKNVERLANLEKNFRKFKNVDSKRKKEISSTRVKTMQMLKFIKEIPLTIHSTQDDPPQQFERTFDFNNLLDFWKSKPIKH